MQPVEINAGAFYLRALRADNRVDDRPALADLGETDPDFVTIRAAQWDSDLLYSWAVCEPTTGELLAEVTLSPVTGGLAVRARPGYDEAARVAAGTARRFAESLAIEFGPMTPTPTPPVTVTVTGAAGSIGYAALFRIAAGAMLGHDTPVVLRLLELPAAIRAAEGVVMELDDGAFPLLAATEIHDDPLKAFDGVDVALLIGAKPRSKGMERADLLGANAEVFATAGKALNAGAGSDVRVLVVGNPANTNAYVAAAHAPDIPRERFTALTRLDHNRAVAALARHARVPVTEIARMTIWGNHSPSQYPDIFHAVVAGRSGADYAVDTTWLTDDFIPTVARRGTAIIEARGASSAASAANGAIDHIDDWVHGTPENDWTSVALPSPGAYGVDEGLVCSFPCRSVGGAWEIVEGLDVNPFSRARIDASVAELRAERDAVAALGLL